MAYQVPEWEGQPPPPSSSEPSILAKPSLFSSTAPPKEYPTPTAAHASRPTFRQRFDSLLPPHRSYLGLKRRLFLLILLALLLLLLALILGLAIGLSRKSSTPFLPLPSSGQTYTGDLTYYGTGLGACGVTSADTDLICAVSHLVFDAAQSGSNPNANPLCGRRIRIVHFDPRVNANKSIDVTVVDRCVGCLATDLDLSPTGFDMLADMALGRVVGSWAWL